jgi:ABC-2 type transport system ATP-binding protein
MRELLRIEGISKSFGRHCVLREFDLAIEPGRVYGLLGRNGEGKTTLARILMGVIPADGGSVLYKGRKITFRDSAYKRDFGYVPEDPFFYDGMTVQRILDFNARFYPRWDSRRAAADLERFALDPKARIRTLSRGMKLKLELAVALAAAPEFLILDDPTSGLDVPTRQDFLREIIRELAASGTAILFATHLVHELERIVERLAILHGGRLILDEEFDKIKAHTKRVTLSFESPPAGSLNIPHAVCERRDGKSAEIVVYPWDESAERAVAALQPFHADIGPMTLEDIFVSFVSATERSGR